MFESTIEALRATGDLPLDVLDALTWPDETAAALAEREPGSGMAAVLTCLDPVRLSDEGRIDALIAIRRLQGWLSGVEQRLLAAVASADAARPRGPHGETWSQHDVGCALRLADDTAQERMMVAAELVTRLPSLLAALDVGRITYLHPKAVTDESIRLDAAQAAALEKTVLDKSDEQTVGAFRRTVRRAALRLAPRAAEQARAEAVAQRRVEITPQDNGMATLWALLPAEGAAAIKAAIDAVAAVGYPGEGRVADQRRANALVELAVAALHDPTLPRSHGMRPVIRVTVAASTLLGLDDQPAELDGHGPIPASVARRIAADPSGTWRRLLTDPSSETVLDYGRKVYRPPADLAAYVIALDRECVFPTCHRGAEHCDIDHRERFPQGRTSAANMNSLCARHHLVKHEAGWRLRHDRSRYEWISPTGHRYRKPNPELAQRPNQETCPIAGENHATGRAATVLASRTPVTI